MKQKRTFFRRKSSKKNRGLPLRFSSGNFALLPAAGSWERSGGCWVKGAGGTWKRMRLTKKTAGSLVRRHGTPHVLHGVGWKRLRSHDEVLGFGARSEKRGRFSLHEHGFFLREGVG